MRGPRDGNLGLRGFQLSTGCATGSLGTPTPGRPPRHSSRVDSGTTSHKNIACNVADPIPLDPAKFALVNKIQGTGKLSGGTFRKLRKYGSIVDANFPTQQVDSVDGDPWDGTMYVLIETIAEGAGDQLADGRRTETPD